MLIIVRVLTAGKAHNVHVDVHVRARYSTGKKEKYEIVGSSQVCGHTSDKYFKKEKYKIVGLCGVGGHTSGRY